MNALLYASPLGLALDIVGFLIVVNYGHALFWELYTLVCKEDAVSYPLPARTQCSRLFPLTPRFVGLQ